MTGMGAFDDDFEDLLLGFSMEVSFTLDPPVSCETRDEEDDGAKQLSMADNPIFNPFLICQRQLYITRNERRSNKRLMVEAIQGQDASVFIERRPGMEVGVDLLAYQGKLKKIKYYDEMIYLHSKESQMKNKYYNETARFFPLCFL